MQRRAVVDGLGRGGAVASDLSASGCAPFDPTTERSDAAPLGPTASEFGPGRPAVAHAMGSRREGAPAATPSLLNLSHGAEDSGKALRYPPVQCSASETNRTVFTSVDVCADRSMTDDGSNYPARALILTVLARPCQRGFGVGCSIVLWE